MSSSVIGIVLLAAMLHASWNAIIKSSPDKFLDIVAVTTGAAILSAMVLPFLPLPHPACLIFLAASVAVHTAYFLLIGASYRAGDMSQAYPLMRGGPPMLIALASGPLLRQYLDLGEWSGVILISAGILATVFLAGNAARLSIGTTRYALGNAGVIAAYTLIDGTGVRLSGNAASYTMWMFLLTGPGIFAWSLFRRLPELVHHLCRRWYFGLLGGACTLYAYVLVLWAMMRAPLAIVAALRETAILFGLAISALVLRERFGASRFIAALVILGGIMAIRLE